MATPLLGQFDPEFMAIMHDVTLGRFAFQTDDTCTFAMSKTGRAGLEAANVSLLEPGDRAVVGECGRFGLLLIVCLAALEHALRGEGGGPRPVPAWAPLWRTTERWAERWAAR